MGMTGREKQRERGGREGGGVAFGERRMGRTVNKEPFTGGGDLVNYNRPSQLTDV